MESFWKNDIIQLVFTLKWDVILPFLSCLFGAYLQWLISGYNRYKDNLNKKYVYISALRGELVSLIRLFETKENEYRQSIIKDNDCWNYNFEYYKISHNYTVVYDNVSGNIGLLEDKVLIERIIGTYIAIKAFYEDLKMLEELALKGQNYRDNIYGSIDFGKDRMLRGMEYNMKLRGLCQNHNNIIKHIIEISYPETKKIVDESIALLDKYAENINKRNNLFDYIKPKWGKKLS